MAVYRALEVEVKLTRPQAIVAADYTAKLVKSLLVSAAPGLRDVFAPEKGPHRPKPVHVSPPLVDGGGRPMAVYPSAMGRRPSGPRAVVLEKGFRFHLGYREELEPLVLEAVQGLSAGASARFSGQWVEARAVSIRAAFELDTEDSDPLPLENGQRVSVSFLSPALPRDPWGVSRFRRLVPASIYVFSLNAYEIAREVGASYWEALSAVAGLVEAHTTAAETKRVWYLYGGRWLPALGGRAAYYASGGGNRLLKKVLAHAAIMGVGSGRAAGFGHIALEAAPPGSRPSSPVVHGVPSTVTRVSF